MSAFFSLKDALCYLEDSQVLVDVLSAPEKIDLFFKGMNKNQIKFGYGYVF